MSELIVARRYAHALNEDAARQQLTEQVDADVELIRESLAGSPELVRFFESPILSREKKVAVIRSLFGDRVQPLVLRFLELLVEKRREDLFPAVVTAYRDLRDEQLGIVEVGVRTAHPLDAGEEQELRDALEKMTGLRVRLSAELDPSLIGGMVIRIGDTVYDGSVQHQLETLREQFEHGTFAVN